MVTYSEATYWLRCICSWRTFSMDLQLCYVNIQSEWKICEQSKEWTVIHKTDQWSTQTYGHHFFACLTEPLLEIWRFIVVPITFTLVETCRFTGVNRVLLFSWPGIIVIGLEFNWQWLVVVVSIVIVVYSASLSQIDDLDVHHDLDQEHQKPCEIREANIHGVCMVLGDRWIKWEGQWGDLVMNEKIFCFAWSDDVCVMAVNSDGSKWQVCVLVFGFLAFLFWRLAAC